MRPEEFRGKQVFVVGGSSGIGRAIADAVVELGAHVTLFARRRELLAAAAAELAAARRLPQQRVELRVLDATVAPDVEAVMTEAVRSLGAPDVLINCAGRAVPRRFEEMTIDALTATVGANLYSCWNTVAALVPHMKARGGYIVNTSSMAGLIGVFGYTDYCASKFAVVGFSEALRSELRPYGITVSVLCPPDTDTPSLAEENRTKPIETKAISARARVLQPEQVAAALLRGMRRQRLLIIPGLESRVAFFAKRFAPWLVEGIMDRTVRSVRAAAARTS
jgi:short-subunit dehydrogenase